MTDTAASCRYCRHELTDGARFCASCGYTTRRTDPSRFIGLLIIALGAVLLLGLSDHDR